MILSIIKNHCKRIWKGEETWWRIACVWVVMAAILYLIAKNELWGLYILFFYVRDFTAYEALGLLLMWIGSFIFYGAFISYSIFITYIIFRQKILGNPHSDISLVTDKRHSRSTKFQYIIKLFPDILIISIVLWQTSSWDEASFIGAIAILSSVYLILGIFYTWYLLLKSKISFLYKSLVFIIFPIIPLILTVAHYCGVTLIEKPLTIYEGDIQWVVEKLTP